VDSRVKTVVTNQL